MAVFKIFPIKDASLYSEYTNMNTGMDEILEISSFSKGIDKYVNRALITFDSAEVSNVLNNHVSSSDRAATDFSASLRLMLASANEVPTSYELHAYPAYVPSGSGNFTDWVTGNGKYGDSPRNSSGVSWEFTQSSGSGTWLSDVPAGVTSSFSGSSGGGAWYTGSGAYNFEATQSHTVVSTHDADINITQGVKAHYNGDINNAGFLVKLDDTNEYQTARQMYLRYFSGNSHTIYPPHLEIKWDDSVDSTNLTEVTDSNPVMKVKNNKGKYTDEGFQKFNLHVRPKYPARSFATSSNYLTNYVLPTASYWGIRDENTEEMVIDFDTTFTKISRDNNGSYFTVHMGGLEPERHYRILIKSTIDGSTNVFDENLVFKVVRNG